MKELMEWVSKPIVAIPVFLVIIALAVFLVTSLKPGGTSHSHGDGAVHSH